MRKVRVKVVELMLSRRQASESSCLKSIVLKSIFYLNPKRCPKLIDLVYLFMTFEFQFNESV